MGGRLAKLGQLEMPKRLRISGGNSGIYSIVFAPSMTVRELKP